MLPLLFPPRLVGIGIGGTWPLCWLASACSRILKFLNSSVCLYMSETLFMCKSFHKENLRFFDLYFHYSDSVLF
jgi:hypothetical protein